MKIKGNIIDTKNGVKLITKNKNKDKDKEYEKILKKKIINDCGDSESDDDDNYNVPMSKKIFYRDNHIYFHDSVTAESINKLTSIIYEINKKEEDNAYKLKMYNITIPEYYLHICSYGGDSSYAFIAYDIIKNSKVKINTIAEGAAISAGSIMYVAGYKKYMRRHSYILIHQLNQFMKGQCTYHDLKDNMISNDKYMATIKKIYLDNCNNKELTSTKLDEILDHDIFWNYEDCVIHGLVDELYNDI
jgi:ATP-dependent Clp protease protease subunit